MTDLLGTCTSWGDGVCVVAPETGDPVEIAIADIVSGKPVPPRPSARHRIDPGEAQHRALALWPDLETRSVGQWLLRHSPTSPNRRANSVLAMGPVGDPGDYEQVVEFYLERTGRPVAAVLPDSPGEDFFLGHGWVPESGDADTVFELASVARARRALRSAPAREVELVEADGLAVARIGDLASGIAAYDRDWVGFRSLEVAPAHRRQGLGLAVMAALLEWGSEQGATTAYLQVLGDNTAALGLYEGLGFTEHHAYRYLASPVRSTD